MPSKSPAQHRFMEAIAHDPGFAKKAGVPVSVGQDFAAADKKSKKFASGGAVGPLTQNHNLLSQTVIQPGDADSIPPIHDSYPTVYGALAGLAGTPPDQLEGSVLEPGYDARQQGAAMTFPIGTALQMIPGLKGLATAMAAEKLVPSGSLAAQRGAIGWHGSPHTFDAFDASKIGTGEGAQAYGHGLYLADSPKVAMGYQKSTGYQDVVRQFRNELPDDADFSEILDLANNGALSPPKARVIKELANNDWLGYDYPSQAISGAFKHGKSHDMSPELQQAINEYGNLYKVDLPDEHIAKMLDWDKPISEQHPDIQSSFGSSSNHSLATSRLVTVGSPEALQRVVDSDPDKYFLTPSMSPLGKGQSVLMQRGNGITNVSGQCLTEMDSTGEDLYKSLNRLLGAEGTTDYLKSLNIPGIKYLDGGSRAAGEGTSNYVIFPGNENKLQILERNGQPLTPPATPDTAPTDPTQQFAQGGSVQDPTTARLHHIVFVKPLDQIGPEDHDFIRSLIQKGRK